MKAYQNALLFIQVVSYIYCKSCVHHSLSLNRCRFLYVFGKNAPAESWDYHHEGWPFSPGGRAGIRTPAEESALLSVSARLI